MQSLRTGIVLTAALGVVLYAPVVSAQSTANAAALKGLATVTVLSQTAEGRAALRANYEVTGGLQTGTMQQPTLYTFAEQQQQALRDAAITWNNLAQLADGLGSTLGAAYVARAHNDANGRALNLSPGLQNLIAYTVPLSGTDSETGKYLFANLTTNGQQPAAPALQSIVHGMHGETDPFGRAYHLPAGSANGNPYGDSRPFQTESKVATITGRDYDNRPATSTSYQVGPAMDLRKSPSYPSGHTTYGYSGSLLLGMMVPDRYPEMIARAAEYGNDRILVGAHYAMDVLGGRTLALYDMAHLLANDPAYMNRAPKTGTPIADYRAEIIAARREVATVLSANCGDTVRVCARVDSSRFNDASANRSFYVSTQTYALPVVHAQFAEAKEDVSAIAPEAGYLLIVAYPSLTLKQADDLLTETEGPGGGFLDDGSAFGVYSRLNLYEAAVRARDMEAQHAPAFIGTGVAQ